MPRVEINPKRARRQSLSDYNTAEQLRSPKRPRYDMDDPSASPVSGQPLRIDDGPRAYHVPESSSHPQGASPTPAADGFRAIENDDAQLAFTSTSGGQTASTLHVSDEFHLPTRPIPGRADGDSPDVRMSLSSHSPMGDGDVEHIIAPRIELGIRPISSPRDAAEASMLVDRDEEWERRQQVPRTPITVEQHGAEHWQEHLPFPSGGGADRSPDLGSNKTDHHPDKLPSISEWLPWGITDVPQRSARRRRPRPYPPLYVGFNYPHDREEKGVAQNRFNRAVRELMRELLGFGPKNSHLEPHPPAEIDDIVAFLGGGEGPSLEGLQLDLVTTSDGIQSHWNMEAARLFADEFLARVDDLCFPENAFEDCDVTASNIKNMFLIRIRYFIRLYQDLYFPLPAREAYESRRFRRMTSRRSSLTSLRKRVCNRIVRALRPIMRLVDDEMISDDETDQEESSPGVKVFRRIERVWVNPELTLIFHMLVDVHLNACNVFGEMGAGSPFRQRINHPPSRVVDTDVVVGLPRNFYNPAWIETLSDGEYWELRCKPAVDLEPFLSQLRGMACCE
ncbi:hypothetical protein AURDEDRAFT_177448 [Auricularia subglabra TFB-10046 SS5]|uniref:Uncharacterized protein n=1 Tax=Auricularia subglabra (strain TFB-10046 / SS5) TaxID=717982 RepID=J0D459_AURST|nr:hypothetical protein AURDEDRAFT_177448 [Auricularia subglabra TFB-10046 SS5]